MTTVEIFIQKRYAEGSNLRYPAMAKKKSYYITLHKYMSNKRVYSPKG